MSIFFYIRMLTSRVMRLLFIVICTLVSSYAFADSVCPPGQYRVKGHRRSSYVRSDGSVVRATFVKAHCKDLTKAAQFFESRIKSGVPPKWPHKNELVNVWTEEEKELLREALDEIPEILMSNNVIGIYRLKKSTYYPNPASSSDGIITIYDSAFDNPGKIPKILAHELCHQNYLDLNEKDRQDYRRETGWRLELRPDRNIYWYGRKEGYVESDGNISPEEDYANNMEHFIYNPDILKNITPKAYGWFKRKFGDSVKVKRRIK